MLPMLRRVQVMSGAGAVAAGLRIGGCQEARAPETPATSAPPPAAAADAVTKKRRRIYSVSLPGTTVTLDGKPIIENGQLRI